MRRARTDVQEQSGYQGRSLVGKLTDEGPESDLGMSDLEIEALRETGEIGDEVHARAEQQTGGTIMRDEWDNDVEDEEYAAILRRFRMVRMIDAIIFMGFVIVISFILFFSFTSFVTVVSPINVIALIAISNVISFIIVLSYLRIRKIVRVVREIQGK